MYSISQTFVFESVFCKFFSKFELEIGMLYFKFLVRLLAALYLLAEFDSNRQKAERPAFSKVDCNQLNRAAAQDCPAKYSSPHYRPLQNLDRPARVYRTPVLTFLIKEQSNVELYS